MKWSVISVSLVLLLGLAFPVVGQDLAEIKTYDVKKVSGDPPVIDGEYSAAEWGNAELTGDFVGLRHSANTDHYWGAVTDVNWRWCALWDDDYFYFCFMADLKYLNMNGWVWSGDMVDSLNADDTGYAGWGIGTNLDFECFITPNWLELYDWGMENSGNPTGYQLCYFPLLADIEGETVYADSNFGVRGVEGPPFFHTGTIGATNLGGWDPIYDEAGAEAAGCKPFKLAALPHVVEGAVEGTDVVAVPVLEIAFPFSQFSIPALTDVETVLDVDETVEAAVMMPDENGVWVEPGDQWLINVAGYTDGPTAENGLGLVSWNDMAEGGFHNAPRGIMTFLEGTAVGQWMVF